MSRYVLSAAARLDLLKIWEYLADEADIDTADRALSDLRQAMRQLANTPGIGHMRPDLARESLRFWLVHSYLIVYRPATRPLQVVRVLHAARDVKSILRGVR